MSLTASPQPWRPLLLLAAWTRGKSLVSVAPWSEVPPTQLVPLLPRRNERPSRSLIFGFPRAISCISIVREGCATAHSNCQSGARRLLRSRRPLSRS